MQNSLNNCIFAGRIINDPQITTVNGANGPFQKATFRVAVDRSNLTPQQRQASRNGDKSVVTSDFFPCSAIGKTAEYIANYCPKGRAVLILAHFTTYKYNDNQTGQEKYGYQFDVESIQFCPKNAQNMVEPNVNGNVQQNNGGYQQQNGGYQQQNNYQQQQNGYQQQNNGGYQQQNGGYQVQNNAGYQPQDNFMNMPQPQPQGNFEMFDNNDSPF